MKILLLFFSAYFIASSSWARDAEFFNEAQLRTRYEHNNRINGKKVNVRGQEDTEQTFLTRTQLGINMRKGESIKAKLLFNHNFTWGSEVDDPADDQEGTNNTEPYQPDGTRDAQNIPLVNEAWLWWKLNESMSVRFGRGQLTLGDGKVMSANDYLDVPYSLDGVVVGWSGALSHTDFFAMKLIENVQPGYVTNDAEMNVYGLSFNVKNPPEIFKMIHFHVMQVIKNEVDSTATTGIGENLPYERGLNYGRYGLSIIGGKFFQYQLSYAAHSGDMELGTTSNRPWNGSMVDGELAVRPAWHNTKLYVGLHKDTGNIDAISNTEHRYDSFLYEQHNTAGAMDVIAWGNLTFVKAGVHIDALEDLRIMLDYYKFGRTQLGDSVVVGRNGASIFAGQVGSASEESETASEIDLSAEHNYDNGLNMYIRLSLFKPGPYLQEAGVTQDFRQFLLQAKIQF